MGELTPKAFDGVFSAPLPGRFSKPRTTGQTMVLDKGLGLTQTGDLLELAGDYVDFVKLTFGTAALYTPTLLRAKIGLIRSYGIAVYPGGTFLEVAITQGALEPYLRRARELGFTHIEVSDGTITMTPDQRREAISMARSLGFPVITEVGKKDGESELDPEEALRQIEADLDAGAIKVIVEGRESGRNAGIFDANGKVKGDDLERLAGSLPDPSILMWEAPLKSQQEALIARFGSNVNLGNIATDEVLAVEALRLGLRGDTLKLALETAAAEGRS